MDVRTKHIAYCCYLSVKFPCFGHRNVGVFQPRSWPTILTKEFHHEDVRTQEERTGRGESTGCPSLPTSSRRPTTASRTGRRPWPGKVPGTRLGPIQICMSPDKCIAEIAMQHALIHFSNRPKSKQAGARNRRRRRRRQSARRSISAPTALRRRDVARSQSRRHPQ